MSSSLKTEIDNYFDGLTKKDIREVELMVKAIRIKTEAMLRYEARKILRILYAGAGLPTKDC